MDSILALLLAALCHAVIFQLASSAAAAGFTQLPVLAVQVAAMSFSIAVATVLNHSNDREKATRWFWERAALEAQISSLTTETDDLGQLVQKLTMDNSQLRSGLAVVKKSRKFLKTTVKRQENASVVRVKTLGRVREEAAEAQEAHRIEREGLEGKADYLNDQLFSYIWARQELREASLQNLEQLKEAQEAQARAEQKASAALAEAQESRRQLSDPQQLVEVLQRGLSVADRTTEERVDDLTSQLSDHETAFQRLYAELFVVNGGAFVDCPHADVSGALQCTEIGTGVALLRKLEQKALHLIRKVQHSSSAGWDEEGQEGVEWAC